MGKKLLQILTFALFCQGGYGQTCAGTLGDPVVKIDFGYGPNPGPPVPQVPAGYTYVDHDCPDVGSYTVRTKTFSCFSDTWHVVPFDHSLNNANSYFLMINGKPGAPEIFVDTIKGLCLNTIFDVSAALLNLVNPQSCSIASVGPAVTFTITDLAGNKLQEFTTPNIARDIEFTWKVYDFQFLASVPDVILTLSETGTSCDNDLGLDDIMFRPCNGLVQSAFNNSPLKDLQVCENQETNYVLKANYNGFTNPQLQWQISYDALNWTSIGGATNSSYVRVPTPVGVYHYRYTIRENGSSCNFYSPPLSITIESLFAQATNYTIGCYGSTVQLFAAGGSFYEWTGPGGFAASTEGASIPNVNFSNTGPYIVKVTTELGCFAYDTTNLVVYAAPVAHLTPGSAFLCEGETVQLQASGDIHYKWSPSDGLSNDTIPNPVAKPTETTTYLVKVYNEHTCYDTASIHVVVWKRPVADAGPDKFTFKNHPVMLQGHVIGSDVTYSWTPPLYLDNTSVDHPKSAPPASIEYTLTVSSNDGCGIDSDHVNVGVIDKIFIPSAFTPNGDGLNDVWEIVTFEEYPNATAEVFDRWGQLVYFNKGLNYKPWDGTNKGQPVEAGTYVYVVDLHNNKKVFTGTVTVVR